MMPAVVDRLVALVVPPACVACGCAVPRAELRLCARCAGALPWLPRRGCPRCALPSHRGGCPAARAAFVRAWAPVAYEGVARDLVAALKFRGALPLAALMAAQIAANLPADLRPGAIATRSGTPASSPDGGGGVALVPVPSRRARRRGFDPAESIAAALAPRLGVERRRCLRRRDRERQVGASRSQRRRGGRIAVELRCPPPERALLVDDVHTTGATLDACARALVAGGCREVAAVTYARTL